MTDSGITEAFDEVLTARVRYWTYRGDPTLLWVSG